MNCPNCNINPAQQTQFGMTPCKTCVKRMRVQVRPPLEFVPESMKEERKKYAKDILQPFRGGELSKEYLDAWGSSKLNVTPEEVRKAKPTWSDLEYYG